MGLDHLEQLAGAPAVCQSRAFLPRSTAAHSTTQHKALISPEAQTTASATHTHLMSGQERIDTTFFGIQSSHCVSQPANLPHNTQQQAGIPCCNFSTQTGELGAKPHSAPQPSQELGLHVSELCWESLRLKLTPAGAGAAGTTAVATWLTPAPGLAGELVPVSVWQLTAPLSACVEGCQCRCPLLSEGFNM